MAIYKLHYYQGSAGECLAMAGANRAGARWFFSYQALENLVGCKIYNADRIIPEFQHLASGDALQLHPQVPFPVAAVEPNHLLVLYFDSRTGIPQKPGKRTVNYFESTWVFLVKKIDNKTIGLITRFRIDYNPGLANSISYGYLIEPIATTMQKKMLKGIKQRAENPNRP